MLWLRPSKRLAHEDSTAALRQVDSLPTPNGIVLCGGQLLVRAARHSVLARAGLDVVSDVADAATAAEAADLCQAGVVLVDADVPGGCVRAVRRIAERAPPCGGARRRA